MAQFDRGKYSIYVHKDMPGDSPASPERPVNEIGARPQSFLRSNTAKLMGAIVVAQAVNIMRKEIAATTGDEELQAMVNNAMITAGLTMAILVKPIAVIPMAASMVSHNILRGRDIERQNRAIQYDNRMRGRKIGHMQGVYYG